MLPDLTLDGNSGWLTLIIPWIGFAVWWLRLQAHGRAGEDAVTADINAGDPRDAGEPRARAVRSTLERSDAEKSSPAAYRAFGGNVALPVDEQPSPSKRANGASPPAVKARQRQTETPQGPLPETLATLELPDAETVEAEIAEASRIGDKLELATLYLQQGLSQREAGDELRSADTIRKCVMLAMQIKDARLHAMGRLELGDIAAGQGDLTTACEHWQMAKKMYFEAELNADSDVADRRMLAHGCPTEWVLTDF